MNVTFCSARYNFDTCDFTSGVVNVTTDKSYAAVLPQYYE